MNLNQNKLSKSEWDGIEIPVSSDEIEILKLIISGFHDVNIKYNKANSLFSHLKIEYNEKMEDYLFHKYFEEIIQKIFVKSGLEMIQLNIDSNPVIKKADLIRINKNNDIQNLEKLNIYEYVLIEQIEKILKYKLKKTVSPTGRSSSSLKKWQIHYYTLYKFLKNSVTQINRHVLEISNH